MACAPHRSLVALGRPPSRGRSLGRIVRVGNSLLSLVVLAILMADVAQGQTTREEFLEIDEGFRIFTEEEFEGNGRTCGTCHVSEEAYNIFPATIAKLNKKQRDLLFVRGVPGLENPDLIESRGLFNISGRAHTCPADDPSCFGDDGHEGPTFRASMGLFAMALTTEPPLANPGTPLLPDHCSFEVRVDLPQLGWSGDGSPGTPVDDPECKTHHDLFDSNADGSIRAFPNGAIAQHLTKSLHRIEVADFRLATDAELDALAAFQPWLGRRPLSDDENAIQGTVGAHEFDITLLDFNDARATLGRDHFVGPREHVDPPGPAPPLPPDPNAGAGCNNCHVNAGARAPIPAPGGNSNLDTRVEFGSDDIGLAVVGVPLPPDEGGSSSTGPPVPFPRLPSFDESFNTQSLIEASQKRGWFHNQRVVDDFEEALAFYITPDFLSEAGAFTGEAVMRNGNASGSIAFPDGDGVEHLGTFLRALNAFYNLRDCERLLDEAIARIGIGVSAENPVRHCQFNLGHVRRVLSEAKHPRVHMEAQHGAREIHAKLNGFRRSGNVRQLGRIKASIRDLRDSIATQTSP